MKTIILAMAVTVFAATAISATPVTSGIVQKAKPTPEERAKAEVKRLTELLALSADQASRIMPLAVQKYKEQRSIRQKNKGNEEVIKSESKKVQTKYLAQLNQILSAEQQAKLRAHKPKMNAKRKKKG